MRLPYRPDAVIFDMDGLLFETEALYRETAILAAREFGIAMTEHGFAALIGRAWPDNRAWLLAQHGAGFPVDAYQSRWMEHFERRAEGGIALKPGVGELLALLDRLGVPRAIATSSSHGTVRRNLSAHGLTDRFPVVVARGDTAAGKPAPDPFLRAAERLGVLPVRCLALEDSRHGVRAAAAAGMMVAMVPDLVPAGPHERAVCTIVAPDLHAVAAAVRAAGGGSRAVPARGA